jgi:hypothetical protein
LFAGSAILLSSPREKSVRAIVIPIGINVQGGSAADGNYAGFAKRLLRCGRAQSLIQEERNNEEKCDSDSFNGSVFGGLREYSGDGEWTWFATFMLSGHFRVSQLGEMVRCGAGAGTSPGFKWTH